LLSLVVWGYLGNASVVVDNVDGIDHIQPNLKVTLSSHCYQLIRHCYLEITVKGITVFLIPQKVFFSIWHYWWKTVGFEFDVLRFRVVWIRNDLLDYFL